MGRLWIPLIAISLLTLYLGNFLRRQAINGELPTSQLLWISPLLLHSQSPTASKAKISRMTQGSAMFRCCPISYIAGIMPTSSVLLLTDMCNSDNKDSSSLVSANYQSSLTLAGTAPLGTAISSAPQTTQEVVLTDVYVHSPVIPVLKLILRAVSTLP